MSIHFLTDDSQESNDLPWANDFIASSGESNINTNIVEIRTSTKGLLLIGRLYKGFVFTGSKSHSQLTEAIDAWKKHTSLPYAVIMTVNEKGRISVGVDDDQQSTVHVGKKGVVSFKYEASASSSEDETANAFLAHLLPSTESTSRVKETPRPSSSSKKTPF